MMVDMDHPYIVAYRGSFRDGPDMYILMDYYEGSTEATFHLVGRRQ